MEAMQMMQLAYGTLLAQSVYVAAKLGVADQLAAGARTSEDLARATGAHPRSLHRLLRALADLGVFAQAEDGHFSLTPLGTLLRTGEPGSVRDAVLMAGDPSFTVPCGQLLHSVLTGAPAFDHVFGAPFFDYLAQHPEVGKVFDAGMANFSDMENAAIAGAYDFASCGRVIDVGGGRGGFLAEVLKAHPSVRGVLYDQPQVVQNPEFITAAGVAPRCEILSGNFFEAVPAGGDAYVLKRILHDWNDETCVAILRRCRDAMAAGGRVLGVDAVLPSGAAFHPAKIADLVMMVVSPGRERTEAEFRTLYEAAGLRLTRIVATPSALSIVEGTRA